MAYSYKCSISFGLVYIPVTLHAAVKTQDVGFNMLDKKTMSRVKYKKTCEECGGREVKQEDIVKGFEYDEDKYVVFTDEDFETKTPTIGALIVRDYNDNPSNFPQADRIETALEPVVKASIITPVDYVGGLMELCQDRRGVFNDMKYLDPTRVELHYDLPLNEIIYDFFDALKSRSRGYASLDYELKGYVPSRLVKLDFLLNGEQVDALSFIVHEDKAYARARRIAEKLKENIPRQLFEIPIQAAIGSKIIARETVKAMRKDVLAKCYGGDITRKKKLLEKQKEGKKKMRQLGSVQISPEAFMAVLRLEDDN